MTRDLSLDPALFTELTAAELAAVDGGFWKELGFALGVLAGGLVLGGISYGLYEILF